MESGQFLEDLIKVWSWVIFSQPHLQRLGLAQLLTRMSEYSMITMKPLGLLLTTLILL